MLDFVKFSYDYENELPVFDKTLMTEFEEIFRREKIKVNYCMFLPIFLFLQLNNNK